MKKFSVTALAFILLLTACGKTEMSSAISSEETAYTEDISETGSSDNEIPSTISASGETVEAQSADYAALAGFIDGLYEEYDLPAEHKDYSRIFLFDHNDGVSDVLFEAYSGTGLEYFVISNTNEPRLEYVFGAFDRCGIFYDPPTERIVIKYISSYGLSAYATSETNFVFLDKNIHEISHVHFSGTSGPEEFYIEENGEKLTCTEEELNKSVSRIESGLTDYTHYNIIGSLTDIMAAV